MLSQLRWAVHVARMPEHMLTKRLFYGELQQGLLSNGGQMKRFKDTLRTSLKVFKINPDTWEKKQLLIELDGATQSTKALVYVKKGGQLQRSESDKQGLPAPAIKGRSPTLLSKLLQPIPCIHRLDQPPAYSRNHLNPSQPQDNQSGPR